MQRDAGAADFVPSSFSVRPAIPAARSSQASWPAGELARGLDAGVNGGSVAGKARV
jgi:hypothetical protein